MESIWHGGTKKPNFPTLKGDIKTDVLIIGGGISGILCGYMLKAAGVDYVIAEQNTICSGVTQNTTAKITYHHGAIFDKMLKRFGKDTLSLYLKAHNEALGDYRNMCQSIDCDFLETDSYVYSLKSIRKIENEVKALNEAGVNAELVTDLPLPLKVSGAVKVKNQAQFNPLKFLYTIAKELNIYENTKVLELLPSGAKTGYGKIKAKKIIVATHFPFINKHGGYFLKMYQHRSYVLALKNAQNVNGIYVDEADTGLSFRNYNNLLLLGGRGHRTGKKGGSYTELRHFANIHYPQSKEITHFATQDCKTLDDIAYIGEYSKNTPTLYVATGFNKWGMTSALVSAKLLCDLITGKENCYKEIFLPTRTILRPQLAINGAESVINLLTPTKPRCPHLGCALKYNKAEHSWDCPCHGSRFSKSGKLLNNPATDDKKL
ncbi:MAG: FAD-dependent oxidoreductase [Clostridia bacterium]|nr:FAD-dependent oxidoreductase [Clostridia bacterium]